MSLEYKKMAGTAAVFILADNPKASPVERDGMVWSPEELKLYDLNVDVGQNRPSIANALALEGLEDYDPPTNGDIRYVDSLDADFIYVANTRSWVQVPSNIAA